MDIFVALTRPLFHRARLSLSGICVVTSLVISGAAFAASEPSLITGEKKSFGYSWEQELKLGAEADKEITESMGLYEDPKLQAYVEAVGQRVLQHSNFTSPSAPAIYRNTKFTFRVMDSPVVNAFALPGGYVYVTRGLLTHVQNEAQLAVVLGHEIAHIAARHSSQQARRSQWTQLGVVAGAILGSKVLGERGADLAPSILNMGGKAAEAFLLRYSREAEHESDTLGVNYATRAGYAAEHSARFFESLKRISAAEGKSLPTWQSSHPDPGDRAQRVVTIANQIPADTRTNVGEEEYLRHIEGMVIGEDPREGFVRNNMFYHPTLRFQFPVAAGWKVDNQRAAVVMAEPSGKARMGLRLAEGANARDAALRFPEQAKVKVVTSGDTMINGLPTTVLIGHAATEQGTVSVWNAFIEHEGKVYSLLGYAPDAAFEQMRPTFEATAAGFSPLRDQAVAAVQPARLKLVRADRNAPFASYVPTALPPELTAEELAILNQVTLNDAVPAGRILKIPEVSGVPVNAMPYSAQPSYPAAPRPAATYPPNNYPPSGNYPPQNSPRAGVPQQPAYPQQTYPQQTYPQQTYPQQTYPPQQSTYPQQNYPAQPGYPQQPAQTYPQSPAQQTYPPAYPPSSTQPAPTYPPQSGYPQFPQPPSSSPQNRNAPPQARQPAPVFPR
jgi:predicted Zn-dependent protease